MMEMAVGMFGQTIAAARRLTMVEYRLLEGGYRRRVHAEHERDVWHAWMVGEFARRQFTFKDMMQIATGKGRRKHDPADPDGGLALQRSLQAGAEFEAWYLAEQAKADAAPLEQLPE